MFGLDQLSNSINQAILNSNPAPGAANQAESLASGLWGAIFPWLSGKVYTIIVTILIIVVVLFIFYGAFLYFTAYGDENRATMAKKTLTYAFVGLIIALLAVSLASYARAVLVKKDQTTNLKVPVTNGTSSDSAPNPLEDKLF